MKTTHSGFTLIELMIVVVIIGVLAAIAYPNYTNHVRNARRSDAFAALTRTAAQLEKYYTQCNAYTATFGNSILACTGIGMANTSPDNFYTLAITDIDPADGATNTISTNYTITATPVAGTPQAIDGKVQLDSTGAKRWDKNNDGSYAASENTWK